MNFHDFLKREAVILQCDRRVVHFPKNS